MKAGLTQNESAKASGLPRYWLGRWERSRATPSKMDLEKLRSFFKLLTYRQTAHLLGFAQRTVVIEFGFSPQRFSARKLIPVNVKTLGDQILLKRIEANLSQPEVAQILGVSIRAVSKWEHGKVYPTEYHWQVLSRIFSLDLRSTPDRDPTPG